MVLCFIAFIITPCIISCVHKQLCRHDNSVGLEVGMILFVGSLVEFIF